jgi:glycosyltransferase involved in cell wall biosynthesis
MYNDVSEIERLLCGPAAVGDIEAMAPRAADAWSLRLPDLSTLPFGAAPWRPLKICIATEDIAGPVRNGGIGTTYAHLAELLVQLGHDCTILYLKGAEVETGTLQEWIDFYGDKGVRFVPVPDYARQEGFRSHADRWLRSPYNMMRYLQDHPMDVVHVSEWRGCGYLSLAAKRQGVAFADTLFIVKTSSPWMWNRLYGAEPVEKIDDLAKIHAERRSVEMADMVIGGSLHLLRWMTSQGYRLPQDRTFVQPNVVSFDNLTELMGLRPVEPATRMAFDEIVFFGRLEGRKGLFVFCQAIERLIRLGVELPQRITFMGKEGRRLTSRPDLTCLEYLDEVTRDWPTEVCIVTHFQQFQALEYLLAGPRLAVMPSLIENSSMAVYEAAICGIPCIASNVGGNAELVAEADRAEILCRPHPVDLGDKLAEALQIGGYIPRPSFNNDANLDVWRQFHDALACGLREDLLAWRGGGEVESGPSADPAPMAAAVQPISICIYVAGAPGALGATLQSLARQSSPPGDVLLVMDADYSEELEEAWAQSRVMGLDCRVIEAFDLDAGAGFNLAAQAAENDCMLFLWEGMALDPEALALLRTVRDRLGADLLTFMHRGAARSVAAAERAGPLLAQIITSVSDAFYHLEVTPMPLLVTRDAFAALEGFSEDYRLLGHEAELIARAQLRGMTCDTVLRELGVATGPSAGWIAQRGYDLSASRFRVVRPLLAAAPLALREMMLMAKGLQAGAQQGKSAGGRAKGRRQDSLPETLAPQAPSRPMVERDSPASPRW